ncbi:isochorismatase family protein [Caulobacter sp. KR2-114]|uniref:isochorismatase family protein n=1 Tax=Caulobacter sp. KR2-114 TaxID=3400912 RepID=UPI003C2ABD94
MGRAQPRLVCLDLQREYVVPGRPLYSEGAGNAAETCAAVLRHARAHGWRVVHVQRRQADGLFERKGYFGAPIEGLRPLISEPVFARSGYSAFCNPDFAAEMRDAFGEDVFLIGFSLDQTCLATAFAAADAGLSITVITDATGPAGCADTWAQRQAAERLLAPVARLAASQDVLAETQEIGA